MAFSNLYFIFGFLPLTLALYFIVPKRGKNIVLLVCSLVFFAWGTPEYILLMACSIVFNFFTCRQIALLRDAGEEKKIRRVLIASVIVNLLLLGFFKYTGFLLSIFGLKARELPAPVGLSFYTFSLLSYLFDVVRGTAPAAGNLLDFSLYVTFFPKLISGPIVRYSEMEPQLRNHPFSREKFGGGARLFLIGLAKKVLLANVLGTTFTALSNLPAASLNFSSAWLCAICYTLMLYFDFGGYSDMAIGLAGMFGFDIKKNFDYPYLSKSVTDFWRRWHISLGQWFRDYVYIPLGGSREGQLRTVRNLLIVWFLTGIWHGAGWNFIFWGLYYGVLLLLEKFVLRPVLEKLPGALRVILTLFAVVIGWVFFFSGSLGDAFMRIGRMFGTGGFTSAAAHYYWRGAWRIVLISVLACLPIGAGFGRQLFRRGRQWLILSILFFALLLALCIAGMMNDTYSTFLYFQF